MRIVNWNVNSIRTRIDRVLEFLQRHDVDVLLMQETKCRDDQFPFDRFADLGCEVAHFGLSQWNGVAIASRVGLGGVETQFPGQPGFHKDPTKPQDLESRAISATCGGVRVTSLYIPNGREIADPHYDYKLRFLYALAASVDTSKPMVFGGDFNIAPKDEHVWSMAAFAGKTHVTEPERQAFAALLDTGLKVTSPYSGYSYWDYKGARFARGEGMLIDFQLSNLNATGSFIDVEERKGKGASDHAPVVVDYEV